MKQIILLEKGALNRGREREMECGPIRLKEFRILSLSSENSCRPESNNGATTERKGLIIYKLTNRIVAILEMTNS